MAFFRMIKLLITFECRFKSSTGEDRVVVDQSIPIPTDVPVIRFASKEEAYRLTGDLKTWAQNFADTFAEDYAFKRCPTATVYPSDWEGIVDEADEWGACPDFVIAEIEELEKRKIRASMKVVAMLDIQIEALKKEYECE